ncbi:hypothetical protein OG905_09350 [Streptomyces sp. NBC_00322]|uniref:hypothetical protein n=1 Tax=Streptomyces sp. NBC_00322 TaxID=2975712 RepID=UPI002E2A4FEF|nr:hypothetical protein [Streptomyces sp. NBC_00322]
MIRKSLPTKTLARDRERASVAQLVAQAQAAGKAAEAQTRVAKEASERAVAASKLAKQLALEAADETRKAGKDSLKAASAARRVADAAKGAAAAAQQAISAAQAANASRAQSAAAAAALCAGEVANVRKASEGARAAAVGVRKAPQAAEQAGKAATQAGISSSTPGDISGVGAGTELEQEGPGHPADRISDTCCDPPKRGQRIGTWLKNRKVKNAATLAETVVEAAHSQHTALPREAGCRDGGPDREGGDGPR